MKEMKLGKVLGLDGFKKDDIAVLEWLVDGLAWCMYIQCPCTKRMVTMNVVT